MYNACVISKEDNIVVVTEHIKKGDTITFKDLDGKEKSIKALDDIRIYHKVAKEDIRKDEPVIKYGEHIGFALCDIKIGEHVHEHNVEGRREDLENLE